MLSLPEPPSKNGEGKGTFFPPPLPPYLPSKLPCVCNDPKLPIPLTHSYILTHTYILPSAPMPPLAPLAPAPCLSMQHTLSGNVAIEAYILYPPSPIPPIPLFPNARTSHLPLCKYTPYTYANIPPIPPMPLCKYTPYAFMPL